MHGAPWNASADSDQAPVFRALHGRFAQAVGAGLEGELAEEVLRFVAHDHTLGLRRRLGVRGRNWKQ